MLILITGLPGSGKTYFANELSKRTGAIHLNTDQIRKQLDLMGQYDDTSKNEVYFEMLSEMINRIKQGKDVIVDATFYRKKIRMLFLEIGQLAGCLLKVIEIKAAPETIQKRVSRKRELSEADFNVYKKIKTVYEPLDIEHLSLWSDQLPIKEMVDQAVGYLALKNN